MGNGSRRQPWDLLSTLTKNQHSSIIQQWWRTVSMSSEFCTHVVKIDYYLSIEDRAHLKGSMRSRCSNGLHFSFVNKSSKRGSTLAKWFFASSNENVSVAGRKLVSSLELIGIEAVTLLATGMRFSSLLLADATTCLPFRCLLTGELEGSVSIFTSVSSTRLLSELLVDPPVPLALWRLAERVTGIANRVRGRRKTSALKILLCLRRILNDNFFKMRQAAWNCHVEEKTERVRYWNFNLFYWIAIVDW